MCSMLYPLYQQLVPQYATHDIECYKLLDASYDPVDRSRDLVAYSPFKEFEYILGKPYGPETVIPTNHFGAQWIINEGFHSFRTKEAALVSAFNNRAFRESILYKSIIPKHSFYYCASDGFSGTKVYVSESIIIEKVVYLTRNEFESARISAWTKMLNCELKEIYDDIRTVKWN